MPQTNCRAAHSRAGATGPWPASVARRCAVLARPRKHPLPPWADPTPVPAAPAPPRCKRHEVPIEKVFNKSLLTKFLWSMDCDPGGGWPCPQWVLTRAGAL